MKGSPPTTSEAYVVSCQYYRNPGMMAWFNAFLQGLYREDRLYADEEFTYWSATSEGGNKQGYERFSTRFARKFSGYMLDNQMRIRAGPRTPVLNFK